MDVSQFLPVAPKKLSELLKHMQHKLPHNRAELIGLQQAILREKVLKDNIFEFRSNAWIAFGSRGDGGSYFASDEDIEPRLLYICSGDPGDTEPSDVGAGIDSGIVQDNLVRSISMMVIIYAKMSVTTMPAMMRSSRHGKISATHLMQPSSPSSLA